MNSKHHKILKFTLLLLTAVALSADESTAFQFTQMGDTHIGSADAEPNRDVLLSAVDSINRSGSRSTIVCGDLVDKMEYRKYADLFKILNGLDSSYYVVPGNHDVGMIPSDQSLAAYRKIVGEDYYSFVIDSTLCIVVNSQLWMNQKKNQSREMDAWLVDLLKSERSEYDKTFIFGHIPFFVEEFDEETEINSNIPRSKRLELLKLFVDYKITAVFTAHLHRHIELKYKGILFSSVESISTKTNEESGEIGIRHWSVFPDSLSSRFIDLRNSVIEKAINK